MTKPLRLDVELVRRKMVGSRTEARRAIAAGIVAVRGVPATKPASLVPPDDPITLRRPATRFVSRGGEKLDEALQRFALSPAGRWWLDAGASTGGFTDRLLQGGAAHVIAIDVGYGQLDWRLRNDTRVTVLERVNVRTLAATSVERPVGGVVADLSFISLALVVPSLASAAEPEADFVLLVKPQFEVGRQAVGPRGVVRSPGLWRAALDRVTTAAEQVGLGLVDACRSPLLGPAGNTEFFVHLRRGEARRPEALEAAVKEAGACASSG